MFNILTPVSTENYLICLDLFNNSNENPKYSKRFEYSIGIVSFYLEGDSNISYEDAVYETYMIIRRICNNPEDKSYHSEYFGYIYSIMSYFYNSLNLYEYRKGKRSIKTDLQFLALLKDAKRKIVPKGYISTYNP